MKQTKRAGRSFFFGMTMILFVQCIHGGAVFGKTKDGIYQRLEIPSAPNPVGSGARALGMGGAFISMADDATCASWNPAGLNQLKDAEASIVWALTHRTEENTFGTNPESDGPQTVNDSRLNFLSMAYPFKIMEKAMSVSLSYQNLYEFNREWDYQLRDRGRDYDHTVSEYYRLDGSLSAFGFSYCLNALEGCSFGITLNFWQDGFHKNEWEEIRSTQIQNNNNDQQDPVDIYIRNRYTFDGHNVTLGFLYTLMQKDEKWIKLGAVFKSPFSADLEWEHEFRVNDKSEPNSPNKKNQTLDMPMSYGIGISCRFSDRFAVALDLYRTEWGDYVLTDPDGDEISPITGKSVSESKTEPTHHVRLGAEYLVLTNPNEEESGHFAILGGLFYDPAPAEGNPDDFYGFSLGAGYGISRLRFNLAYQFRFGNNVGDSILEYRQFSQDIQEHKLYSSAILYF